MILSLFIALMSVAVVVVQGFNCPTCGRESCGCYSPTAASSLLKKRSSSTAAPSSLIIAQKGGMINNNVEGVVQKQQLGNDVINNNPASPTFGIGLDA